MFKRWPLIWGLFFLVKIKRNGGGTMIRVIFDNGNDPERGKLEVDFADYDALKSYLDVTEGLVVLGITYLRE
jgi:hypothetical protein